MNNEVNHPDHYSHQSIKCYEINQHYLGNIAAVIKYLWRCEHKGNKLQDLQKAAYYIKLELDRMFDEAIYEEWVKHDVMYFDDLKLNFPKNIYFALAEIYGGYNKKKLLICLEYINNEIKQIQGS